MAMYKQTRTFRQAAASIFGTTGIGIAKAKLLAKHMDNKKIVQTIEAGDVESLKAIGFNEAEAKCIIVNGQMAMANHPMFAEEKVWHYTVPYFSYGNAMDEEEINLHQIIATSGNFSMVMEGLKRLVAYEKKMEDEPLRMHCANGDVAMLPSSIMAYKLGIEKDSFDTQLAVFDHGAAKFCSVNKAVFKGLVHKERENLQKQISLARKLFFRRSTKNGIVDIAGVKYDHWAMSNGQLRKGTGYWMRTDVFNRPYIKKLRWGGLSAEEWQANLSKKGKVLPQTKILQLHTLPLSACVPSSEVLGKPLLLKHMMCIPEYEKEMTCNSFSVNSKYEIHKGTHVIKASSFDGCGFMDITKTGAIVLQSRNFAIKGNMVAVDIHGYCRDMGYEKNPNCFMVEDYQGNLVDIKAHDIWAFVPTSVWKAADLYESWDQYVQCMHELDLDEFYVCAIDDVANKNMSLSNQMVQSLYAATDEELWQACEPNRKRLDAFSHVESATKILQQQYLPFERRSNLAKLLSVYPEMISCTCVQKELHDGYKKVWNQTMSGKLEVNGRYMFALPDMTAYMDIVFGKKAPDDPNLGIIKPKHARVGEIRVSKTETLFHKGEHLIVLRSPHASMEWLTIVNDGWCKYMPACAIYFSVHDSSFKVLQMDFDGDHVGVVYSPILQEAADREKRCPFGETNKEHLLPITYPAAKPDPKIVGKLSSDPDKYADRMAECVIQCIDFNKVGELSDYISAAWAQIDVFDPSRTPSENWSIMYDVFRIATAMNYAIDAMKTYSYPELSFDVTKKYQKKPYNYRFRRPNAKHGPDDSKYWDKICVSKPGNGSIDRLGKLIRKEYPIDFKLDTSEISYDWRLMLDRDERFNHQLNGVVLSDDIVDKLHMPAEDAYPDEKQTYCKAKEGKPVKFKEFAELLNRQNAAFFHEMERDDDIDFGEKRNYNADRNKIVKKMLVRFAKLHADLVEGMTDEEVERFVSVCLLKSAFAAGEVHAGMDFNAAKRRSSMQRFALDLFGDLYAECVVENTIAVQKEFDDLLEAMKDPNFKKEHLAAQDEDDEAEEEVEYDFSVVGYEAQNAMDDLMF